MYCHIWAQNFQNATLGMGKPIGFGSVEIDVESIQTETSTLKPEQISEKAKQKVKELWDAKTDEDLSQKLENFFKIFYYIANETVEVRYPKLKKEEGDQENGYMELKDGKLKPEHRLKDLTTPWTSWG